MEIKTVVDKIGEIALDTIEKYILQKYRDKKSEYMWKNIISRACNITEGISSDLDKYIWSCKAVKKYFIMLNDNAIIDDIYYRFIITIAMELN